MMLLLAFAIGVIAGLRSMTAPAVMAWGAHAGRLALCGTPLALLSSAAARYSLTGFAIAELVMDKLPTTPSRTRPGPFVWRLLTGALSGAAITSGAGDGLGAGAVAGALGALLGALGGNKARTGLVRALKVPDYVVAVAEDVVAVGGACLIVSA